MPALNALATQISGLKQSSTASLLSPRMRISRNWRCYADIHTKVIWLNCGNVSNATVRRKLLDNVETIQRFIASVENGVLEIE